MDNISMTEAAHPFKVWSCDRGVRKSVTASSLHELLKKGCCKLNLHNSSVKIVLEKHGGEVNEDNFMKLPDNTIVMLLKNDEQWSPVPLESAVTDESDSGSENLWMSSIGHEVESLRCDILNITSFSALQLVELTRCDPILMRCLLNASSSCVSSARVAIEYLGRMDQMKEAVETIRLTKSILLAAELDSSTLKARLQTMLKVPSGEPYYYYFTPGFDCVLKVMRLHFEENTREAFDMLTFHLRDLGMYMTFDIWQQQVLNQPRPDSDCFPPHTHENHKHMTKQFQPFRVWNHDYSVIKCIFVSSLKELLAIGCLELSLTDPSAVKIVLQEDGTEVDEEDYFACLPAYTTFNFLQNSEHWRLAVIDHDLHYGVENMLEKDNSNQLDDLNSLIKSLRHNIFSIILFSDKQRQVIVDYETTELAGLMGMSLLATWSVQVACQRLLGHQALFREALDLLEWKNKVLVAEPSSDEQVRLKTMTEPSSDEQCVYTDVKNLLIEVLRKEQPMTEPPPGRPSMFIGTQHCYLKAGRQEDFLCKGVIDPITGAAPVCIGHVFDFVDRKMKEDVELASVYFELHNTAMLSSLFKTDFTPADRIKCYLSEKETKIAENKHKWNSDHSGLIYEEDYVRNLSWVRGVTFSRDVTNAEMYFTSSDLQQWFLTPTVYDGSQMRFDRMIFAGGMAKFEKRGVTVSLNAPKSKIHTAPYRAYHSRVGNECSHTVKKGFMGFYKGFAPFSRRAFPASAAFFLGYNVCSKFQVSPHISSFCNCLWKS